MKKLRLLAKENNTKKKSYCITAVDDNQLFYDCSHDYYYLKRKLKVFKYWKNYDYYENYEKGNEIVIVHYSDPQFKKSFLFYVIFNPFKQRIGIYLKFISKGILNPDEDDKYISSFNLYRNPYVTQHFNEFICVWTRLALEYENFEVYENIIDEYVFYRQNFKKYLRIIEMGCRFRKQCWMHKMPVEIRKKIYDGILKTNPKQLLECREFSKRLFPY